MRERSIDRLFRRYRDHRDARALAELFDRVAPELARIATHFSKTSDEVEDAVQTAFLTAIERPEMVDPERSFLPWMIGVVTNRCRDLARKRARSPEPDRLRQPEALDPAGRAEDEEFQDAVERGVEKLAPKYRSAVQAYLAEGLAPREIAAREGITPNAASVRLHRGLRALRKALPASFALGAAGLVGTPALASVRRHVLEAGTGGAVVAVSAQKGALVAGFALAGGALSLAAFMLLSSPEKHPLTRGTDEGLSPVELTAPSSVETQTSLAALIDAEPERESPQVAAATKAEPAEPAYRLRVRSSGSKLPVKGATCRGVRDGEEVVLARTDAEGIAAFAGALEFAQLNRVDAEGHVSWRRSLVEGRGLNGIEGFRHATPLPQDLSEIVLDPGTAQKGVVLDKKTRKPIADALIYVFETKRGMPNPILDRPVGKSDAQGAFVVDGGVPLTNEAGGNVMLFAVAPASLGSTERTGSAAFPVLGTEARDPVKVLCIPSLRAAVTVRDESGQPLSGVRVAARPGAPPWGLDWTSNEKLTSFEASHPPELLERFLSETDARGVASFDRLTAGSASGMTGAKPHEALWAFGFQLVDEEWSGVVDRGLIAASATAEIELVAKRKRTIRVLGVCVREGGEPLARANVGHVHPSGKSTVTDGEGRFDLGDFDSTQFPIRLAANPSDGPSAILNAQLPAIGQHELVVRFELAAAIGVRGTLVDESGVGLPGAQLMLLSEGRGDQTESQRESGAFEFPFAGPGRHELRVIAPDGRTRVLVVEAGPQRIEVVLPSVEKETSLVLKLVDSKESGDGPVPVSVKFTNEMGGTFSGSHDFLGVVTHSPRRIIREPGLVTAKGVPAGTWIIEIECTGYPAHTIAVDLEEAAGVIHKEIVLESAGVLKGRVLDGVEGEAVFLDFSRVLLEGAKYDERALNYWNIDGISAMTLEPVFRFELTPGSWWVTARQKDRAAFIYLEVESGENPPIELALEACARIELNSTDLPPGQTPLLDLRVGAGRVRHVPSPDFDEKGMFFSVPPDRVEWRVYVLRDRMTGAVEELARGQGTLEPGETRVIDL